MEQQTRRRWFRFALAEWLVLVVILSMLLLILESPSYYAIKGSTTGIHYGPIRQWLTGQDGPTDP